MPGRLLNTFLYIIAYKLPLPRINCLLLLIPSSSGFVAGRTDRQTLRARVEPAGASRSLATGRPVLRPSGLHHPPAGRARPPSQRR